MHHHSEALILQACKTIWIGNDLMGKPGPKNCSLPSPFSSSHTAGDDPESQLIRAVAQNLARLPEAAACTASASQLGAALAPMPLWAKWKKTTGKTLQALIATDTTQLVSMASVGKGAEKGVKLHGDVVGIALSMLHDACEVAWRPSRGKTAWAKCELARMIVRRQHDRPDSTVVFR